MEKIAYCGLDPGKSGFITIFYNNQYKFYPMPEEKVETGEFTKTRKPKTVTQFSEEGLRDLIFEIKRDFPDCKFKVAIEEVTGRHGWSAQNNFNFGHTAGMQKMVFIMLGAEIVMVRPQKWQSFMRQGYPNLKKKSSSGKTMISDPKAVAELIVKTEFPEIDFRKSERARKNDDNKIDSFLICLYLYRINNQ